MHTLIICTKLYHVSPTKYFTDNDIQRNIETLVWSESAQCANKTKPSSWKLYSRLLVTLVVCLDYRIKTNRALMHIEHDIADDAQQFNRDDSAEYAFSSDRP